MKITDRIPQSAGSRAKSTSQERFTRSGGTADDDVQRFFNPITSEKNRRWVIIKYLTIFLYNCSAL